MVLTYVDQLFGMVTWNWTLNKGWSLNGVQQTFFLDEAQIQLLSGSNSGLKFKCSAPFELSEMSPIDNNKLTCLWIFILQIHMVTQLDSLIWVYVNFVTKITKQVSSSLDHVCTFKLQSQNWMLALKTALWSECSELVCSFV